MINNLTIPEKTIVGVVVVRKIILI